jgi:dynein heavy chain 1
MYGGRLDNAYDQAALDALVDSLFTMKAYERNFPLALSYSSNDTDSKGEAGRSLVSVPEGHTFEAMQKWVEAMPDLRTPELLGLPSTAELMLLTKQGMQLSSQLLVMQDLHGALVDDAVPEDEETKSQRREQKPTQPLWLQQLAAQLTSWFSLLPDGAVIEPFAVTDKKFPLLSASPMFRCLQRELQIWSGLLHKVRRDVLAVQAVIGGASRATNQVRELLKSLQDDVVPKRWLTGCVSGQPSSPQPWVLDLVRRLQQLAFLRTNIITKASVTGQLPATAFAALPVWLGGLASPESYVQATRQTVAERWGWSLEQVHLSISVTQTPVPSENSFLFSGFTLLGAEWDGALSIRSSHQSFSLPITVMTWKLSADAEGTAVDIPVYLEQERSKFLFSVRLSRGTGVPESVWAPRGTCVTLWNPTYTYAVPSAS